MSDTMPHVAAPPDLLAIEAQQRALYSALADYQQAQAGEAYVVPGAFGLAVYHSATVTRDGVAAIEAFLVHANGGMLSSGEVPITDWQQHSLIEARRITGAMVLGLPLDAPGLDDVALFKPSSSKQTQPARPKAVASAGPERRTEQPTEQGTPLAEPAPAPAAPVVAAEPEAPAAPSAPGPADAVSDDEVSAVIDALDKIHGQDPEAVKSIVASFKAAFPIGRTSFARAITTRERLDWLTTTIAEVERNLQAAAEVAA